MRTTPAIDDDVLAAVKQFTAAPCHALVGHRQVTDAYLLGLAFRYGGRLATFDHRAAAPVAGDDRQARLVERVPTGSAAP